MGARHEVPGKVRIRDDGKGAVRGDVDTRTGRRQAPRYPIDVTVRARGPTWRGVVVFRAKDVSRRGLFVITESPPDIYTDVSMTVSLPWGGDVAVKGRVVYTMTAERARSLGVQSGFGVEFRALTESAKGTVERLLKYARNEYFKRCVPVRTDVADQTRLNPIGHYVLGAVDGERSIKSIADWLQLDGESASTVMEELEGMELIAVDPTPSLRAHAMTRASKQSEVTEKARSRGPARASVDPDEDSGLRVRRDAPSKEDEPQSSGPVASRPPGGEREFWDVDAVLKRIAQTDVRSTKNASPSHIEDTMRAYFALSGGDSEALRTGTQEKLVEVFQRLMSQGPTLRDSLPPPAPVPAPPSELETAGTLPSQRAVKPANETHRSPTAIDRLLRHKSPKAGRY